MAPKSRYKICRGIPCTVYSDRLVLNFLTKEDADRIEKLIESVNSRAGRYLEKKDLENIVLEFLPDRRMLKYILKAMKHFYDFENPSANLSGPTLEEVRRELFTWLNEKYNGFMPRVKRGHILSEFSKLKGISLDTLNRALSYSDYHGLILRLRRDLSADELIGLTNYYLLVGLISRASKIHIEISGSLGRVVKQFFYAIKKLRLFENFDVRLAHDKVIMELSMEEYSFAGRGIALGSEKLAYLISILLNSREIGWDLKCHFPLEQSLSFKLSNRSTWFPHIKTPQEISDKIKSIFDSALEERVYQSLIEIIPYKILRESDLLVLTDGSIMIPDYTLICGDKKVFFELIGYWRKEYIEKKNLKLGLLPRDINMVLLLTETTWPLIKSRLPKVKVSPRNGIIGVWREKLRKIVDALCSNS